MSSAISAGTTSGTAIAISGDTSGQLVLQTNGTTTAVTISTGQVVTLAQPLPVASGGSGVTTSTGTGANVLGTSPTLATPTFDSAQLATISGTAPLYMCRAWVNFNGTGTVAIRGSGNVSSITDNGTGDYTVNFTTAMVDANYTTIATCTQRGGGAAPPVNYSIGFGSVATTATSSTYSTTQIRLYVQGSNGSANDIDAICVQAIR